MGWVFYLPAPCSFSTYWKTVNESFQSREECRNWEWVKHEGGNDRNRASLLMKTETPLGDCVERQGEEKGYPDLDFCWDGLFSAFLQSRKCYSAQAPCLTSHKRATTHVQAARLGKLPPLLVTELGWRVGAAEPRGQLLKHTKWPFVATFPTWCLWILANLKNTRLRNRLGS